MSASYLAKRALHASQVVILMGVDAMRPMDVVYLKTQPLHLLEEVVQSKDLAEGRVQVTLDDLCPVYLAQGREKPMMGKDG